MATHSSVLAWKIPGTGGAWWAAVCGVAQSRTRRHAHGDLTSLAPHESVCGNRGSLRTMHGGGSAPLCCAFTHRVDFEEGSGPRPTLQGDRKSVV